MKKGWQTKMLGELCDVLDHKRKPITKRDRDAGEYPYYGATGVLDHVAGYLFDEPLVLGRFVPPPASLPVGLAVRIGQLHVFGSLRELALSFFPQYVKLRRKTLRTYSIPVDLRRHDPSLWVTRNGFCHELVDILTGARHFAILPAGSKSGLRPIDPIEARANALRDYR